MLKDILMISYVEGKVLALPFISLANKAKIKVISKRKGDGDAGRK